MTRYTVEPELMVGGWLWQVVDSETGWRSIPAAKGACVAMARHLKTWFG